MNDGRINRISRRWDGVWTQYGRGAFRTFYRFVCDEDRIGKSSSLWAVVRSSSASIGPVRAIPAFRGNRPVNTLHPRARRFSLWIVFALPKSPFLAIPCREFVGKVQICTYRIFLLPLFTLLPNKNKSQHTCKGVTAPVVVCWHLYY